MGMCTGQTMEKISFTPIPGDGFLQPADREKSLWNIMTVPENPIWEIVSGLAVFRIPGMAQ